MKKIIMLLVAGFMGAGHCQVIAAWDFSSERGAKVPAKWTIWTSERMEHGSSTAGGLTLTHTAGKLFFNSVQIDDGTFTAVAPALLPLKTDGASQSVYEDMITQLNGSQQFTLSGLTPGVTYQVQFLGSFARADQNLIIVWNGERPVNLISEGASVDRQVVYSSYFTIAATDSRKDVSFSFNRRGTGNMNSQGISGMVVSVAPAK